MSTIRKSNERGHTQIGWLDSYHTFSFDQYYDPHHMGFQSLRVINEDRISPGTGFGTHPHRDMEIITYVLEGELEHKDSMGNGSIIRPGEIQRMSAGTGITHSEYNPSSINPVHLLQIWIIPDQKGYQPSYEQIQIDLESNHGKWILIASPTGESGSVTIHQNAYLWAVKLPSAQSVTKDIPEGKYGWLQVARGTVTINGTNLESGDALAISEKSSISITSQTDAELLLFILD